MSGKYCFFVVTHCLCLLCLSLLQWSMSCGLGVCDISTPSRYQIQAARCLDVRLVSMLEYWLTSPCEGLLPATHRYCELRGEIVLLQPIDSRHYFTSQKHWQSCSSHNHPLSSTMLYEPSEEEQVIEIFYLGKGFHIHVLIYFLHFGQL